MIDFTLRTQEDLNAQDKNFFIPYFEKTGQGFPINLKVGECINIMYGPDHRDFIIFSVFRMKEIYFWVEKLQCKTTKEPKTIDGNETMIQKESMEFTSKLMNCQEVQNILLLGNTKRVTREEWEHFFRLFIKTVFIRSVPENLNIVLNKSFNIDL